MKSFDYQLPLYTEEYFKEETYPINLTKEELKLLGEIMVFKEVIAKTLGDPNYQGEAFGFPLQAGTPEAQLEVERTLRRIYCKAVDAL